MRAQALRATSVPILRTRRSGERPAAAAATPRRAESHPQIVDEDLFRSALSRERRRADRSNTSFALILITVDDRAWAAGASQAALAAAVGAAKRESDVAGWFSADRVLGVILPDLAANEAAAVRAVDGRLRRELARRLPGNAASSVIVEPRVHPMRAETGRQVFPPIDPLLEDFRVRRREADLYAAVKRAFDAVGSAILLVALAPVFLVIAALIRLGSRGPVFFRQPRIGQMGAPFTMLKFRTMYVNADHALHQAFVTDFISSSAGAQADVKTAPFKLANDPRITPVGRVLRKTSLDEFPQLWNVLMGEMSLVGPRPPLSYEVDQYKSWHRRRILEVKPGMTGLWQVAGRSRTTFDEMVRLDLRYARSCSLWTDIKILLATPLAVISGKGAA